MKKVYFAPKAEIMRFDVLDIVTADPSYPIVNPSSEESLLTANDVNIDIEVF